MRIWIDGLVEIDGARLDIGSVRRSVIERGVSGVDGVCSIDLGSRGREIVVEGVLRAVSGIALDRVTADISSMADGGVHSITTDEGKVYSDARIDDFVCRERSFGGSGVKCKCRLELTQLKV